MQQIEFESGCYLDGSQGWHNSYRVVDLAERHGFQVEPEARKLIADYIGWHESGDPMPDDLDYATAMDELSDEATDYLGSLLAEDDHREWDWDEGALSLMCPCQIEGTEESTALMRTRNDQCDRCRDA